jgi:hypothetical protein
MLLNSPARGHDDVSRRDSRPTSTPSALKTPQETARNGQGRVSASANRPRHAAGDSAPRGFSVYKYRPRTVHRYTRQRRYFSERCWTLPGSKAGGRQATGRRRRQPRLRQ